MNSIFSNYRKTILEANFNKRIRELLSRFDDVDWYRSGRWTLLVATSFVAISLLGAFWFTFMQVEEATTTSIGDEISTTIWYPPTVSQGDSLNLFVSVLNKSNAPITVTVSITQPQTLAGIIIPNTGSSTLRELPTLQPNEQRTEEFALRTTFESNRLKDQLDIYVQVLAENKVIMSEPLLIETANIGLPVASGNIALSGKLNWIAIAGVLIVIVGVLKNTYELVSALKKKEK